MKMKNKRVILEYRQTKVVRGHKKPKWGFCFKTTDGHTLLESGTDFTSLAKAEQGFVSLVKSIATNEYQVAYPAKARVLANN
jgi:hypothetical protein